MIFDTHCHLNSKKLYPNIIEHIENAKKAGVSSFLVVGYNKETSLLAVQIAEKFDFCYAAIGFHPSEIFDVSEEDFQEVFKYVKHPKVKAIGEIGLDYHWEKDPIRREIQKEYFIRQIEIANEANLPITVHNRESNNDCFEILKEYRPKMGGIMHCCSCSVEMMKELVEIGMYISLGGPVTFTNAKTPKEVAYECPEDRLLVETDAPYLSPHPLRGTINVPKNIELVVDEIAKIRDISKKHLEDILYNNSCRILNIK